MLSGVDFGYNNGANEVRFILDGNGYSASEDESDGWRSYLNDLNSFNGQIRNTFDETEVIVQEADSDEGVFNFICSLSFCVLNLYISFLVINNPVL